MTIKDVCDRLSREGISYGVPKGKDYVMIVVGERSAEFNPALHTPAQLDEVVAQCKALRQ